VSDVHLSERPGIRSASSSAALTVGLLLTAACGLGQLSGPQAEHAGPSRAVDTAPTSRQPVVLSVRVHGCMGRPGVHPSDAAVP
jgi:hypothetical protein